MIDSGLSISMGVRSKNQAEAMADMMHSGIHTRERLANLDEPTSACPEMQPFPSWLPKPTIKEPSRVIGTDSCPRVMLSGLIVW